MTRTTQETRFLLTARNKTGVVFRGVRGEITSITRSVSGLQASLLGLAGIGGFGALTHKLISTNREFQTIKSSLKTVTGGATQAAEAFEKITEFATTTPFDLQQVTQAFIKMKSLGLDASEAALRSYGNTASAMGKSLNQMIEAVADASTGEFERLKEFGIRASKDGEAVTFTFQGISETIRMNSEEITRYLQNIGNTNFATAMADQMKNLEPAFSNLNAAIDQLYVDIGEAGLNETLAELINNTTAWLNAMDRSRVIDFIDSAITGFGEVADIIDSITDFIAPLTAGSVFNDLEANGIPGGSPRYQLGDFNAGRDMRAFDEWAEAIRNNTRAIQNDQGPTLG